MIVVLRLQGHKKSVRCVAYSPDGQLLATGGEDKRVMLWEWAKGNLVAAHREHDATVFAVGFSPDGETLASGGGASRFDGRSLLCLWPVPWGPVQKLSGGPVQNPPAFYACLAFHPGGRGLAASSRGTGGGGSILGGEAGYWELGLKPTWMSWVDRRVYALTLSPDGQRLAIAVVEGPNRHERFLRRIGRGGREEVSTPSSRVYVRPWSGENPLLLPHRIRVWSLAFDASGDRLASATGKEVDLWDLSTPDHPIILEGHTREVRAVAFSPDRQSLASGGLDGLVILWDVAAGRERVRFDWGLGPVYAVAFAPDGDTLAVAGEGILIIDIDARGM